MARGCRQATARPVRNIKNKVTHEALTLTAVMPTMRIIFLLSFGGRWRGWWKVGAVKVREYHANDADTLVLPNRRWWQSCVRSAVLPVMLSGRWVLHSRVRYCYLNCRGVRNCGRHPKQQCRVLIIIPVAFDSWGTGSWVFLIRSA